MTSFLLCIFFIAASSSAGVIPIVSGFCRSTQNETPRVTVSWKGQAKLFVRININVINIVFFIGIFQMSWDRNLLCLSPSSSPTDACFASPLSSPSVTPSSSPSESLNGDVRLMSGAHATSSMLKLLISPVTA
jgi:hypothetical protein